MCRSEELGRRINEVKGGRGSVKERRDIGKREWVRKNRKHLQGRKEGNEEMARKKRSRERLRLICKEEGEH